MRFLMRSPQLTRCPTFDVEVATEREFAEAPRIWLATIDARAVAADEFEDSQEPLLLAP